MIPRIVTAVHSHDYVIRLVFQDGTEGEVDLSQELFGEVFEPLRDPSRFREFRVDADLHTIVWPGGADFAPEFLYDRVRVMA